MSTSQKSAEGAGPAAAGSRRRLRGDEGRIPFRRVRDTVASRGASPPWAGEPWDNSSPSESRGIMGPPKSTFQAMPNSSLLDPPLAPRPRIRPRGRVPDALFGGDRLCIRPKRQAPARGAAPRAGGSGERLSGRPSRAELHALPDSARPNHGRHSKWFPNGAPRACARTSGEPVGVCGPGGRTAAFGGDDLRPERPGDGGGAGTSPRRAWRCRACALARGPPGTRTVASRARGLTEGQRSESGCCTTRTATGPSAAATSGKRVGKWEYASRPGL